MSDSNNLLQGINPTEDLMDIKKSKSLKKVCEEIQQAIDVVESCKRQIKAAEPPVINGKPWYKLSFGKASVEDVNAALKAFSDYAFNTFNLIATTQGFQNENDQSLCRLIGLLAMAEANTYSKINELSTEDEASAKQLKRLQEEFEKSIEDAAKDCSKKGDQMNILIDYITCFAESKTKKIRAITVDLSDIKIKLDKYLTNQTKWRSEIETDILSWKDFTNKYIDKIRIQIDEELNILNEKTASALRLKEDIAQLQSNNETLLERVQNLEKAINKKSFLDSMWYKASVGVAALVALGISIFSVL